MFWRETYPPASWPNMRGNNGVWPWIEDIRKEIMLKLWNLIECLGTYQLIDISYPFLRSDQVCLVDHKGKWKLGKKASYLGFPEVNVSVAKRGVEDLQTHFTSLWWCHLYFLNHQWLPCLPCYRGCHIHAFQLTHLVSTVNSNKTVLFIVTTKFENQMCTCWLLNNDDPSVKQTFIIPFTTLKWLANKISISIIQSWERTQLLVPTKK